MIELEGGANFYVDGMGRRHQAGKCAMCGDDLTEDNSFVTVDGREVCGDCADNTI